MGGLEFPEPGQQGLTVGLVLFHREPSRPGPAHWRFVCAEVQKGPADVSHHLHGRFDLSWRASSLLVSWWPLSYWGCYCHCNSHKLQLHNCLKQLWIENSSPEAIIIFWLGMSIKVLAVLHWFLLIHDHLYIFLHSKATTNTECLPNHQRYDVSSLKSFGFRKYILEFCLL